MKELLLLYWTAFLFSFKAPNEVFKLSVCHHIWWCHHLKKNPQTKSTIWNWVIHWIKLVSILIWSTALLVCWLTLLEHSNDDWYVPMCVCWHEVRELHTIWHTIIKYKKIWNAETSFCRASELQWGEPGLKNRASLMIKLMINQSAFIWLLIQCNFWSRNKKHSGVSSYEDFLLLFVLFDTFKTQRYSVDCLITSWILTCQL